MIWHVLAIVMAAALIVVGLACVTGILVLRPPTPSTKARANSKHGPFKRWFVKTILPPWSCRKCGDKCKWGYMRITDATGREIMTAKEPQVWQLPGEPTDERREPCN